MENPNRPQLQELTPSAIITNELVDLQTQCTVCFVEFYLNEGGVRRLQCGHLYHGECLFPWLQRNASCPVCRAPLSTIHQSSDSFMERSQINMSALSDNLSTISDSLTTINDNLTTINNGLTTIRDSLSRLSNRMTNTFGPLREILEQQMQHREQTNLRRRQFQEAVRLINSATTATASSISIPSPNVNIPTNRTPLQISVCSVRSVSAHGVNMNNSAIPTPNINAQTSEFLPQTVVSSTRPGGYESPVRSLHESTYAADEVSVTQRRAALRALTAISSYRRKQRNKNLKTIDQN